MVNPKQTLHFNDGKGHEKHIPFDEFSFHPVLKDIENFFGGGCYQLMHYLH